MAVEGGGDYRRRLVKRKQSVKQNKAARERAFSTPAPPPARSKAWMGIPGADKYPWQADSVMEAAVSAALGLGGVTLGKLAVDPQRSARMAWADQAEGDPMMMGADNPRTRMLMEAAIPGGGVAGPTRKVFAEMLQEAAARGSNVGTRASTAAEARLGPLVEQGLMTDELFNALTASQMPRFDRVLRAAEEAGIADLPVYRSIADLPKRGAAIVGNKKEPAVREGQRLTALAGRLLGSEFPGSTTSKSGWDPAALERNASQTILRGESLFGDIVSELSPMRDAFYPMVNRGFVKPVSEVTGLSEDVISQIGSSLSPRKQVPVEMAQAAELAQRISRQGTKGSVKSLTRGMKSMGLGQLIEGQTKNLLKVIDKPSHLNLTPANIKKISVYALNKAAPEVSEAAGYPAYTFDTWQRRAMGFADDVLPGAGKQYREIVEAIARGAQSEEAIAAIERQLRNRGYSAAEARKAARIPNVGQAIVWSDARNQIGDVLGRMF